MDQRYPLCETLGHFNCLNNAVLLNSRVIKLPTLEPQQLQINRCVRYRERFNSDWKYAKDTSPINPGSTTGTDFNPLYRKCESVHLFLYCPPVTAIVFSL